MIVKLIVLIKESFIFWKKWMFVKAEDMQHFIRTKTDFDKKSCLKFIKGASLTKHFKIKTK